MTNSRLLIVQPYVPQYRVPFFEMLIHRLSRDGVDCQVAAAEPLADQQARKDSSGAHSWLKRTRSRQFVSRYGIVTYYGSRTLHKEYDAVIVPAAGTCLDTHFALISRPPKSRVGLWGHIADYVGRPHALDGLIEGWQLRRAGHVFAYTAGGARCAKERGVDDGRLTILRNTIDTSQIEAARQRLTQKAVDELGRSNRLTRGRTALYLGGLDEEKRVDLLADVLETTRTEAPDFKLIVCGEGSQSHLLQPATDRGQVVRMGYADAEQKVLAAAAADVLLNPGRVGLVAVDALALGLPIVTTHGAHHAPEMEYLVDGIDVFTAAPEVRSLTDLTLGIAERQIRPSSPVPTLDDMVDHFRDGALKLIGA